MKLGHGGESKLVTSLAILIYIGIIERDLRLLIAFSDYCIPTIEFFLVLFQLKANILFKKNK